MLSITSNPYDNLSSLKNENGENILNERCHCIFKINDFLFGYRVGLRAGLVNSKGEILLEPILKGFTEWELSKDQIDKSLPSLYIHYNEEYNCRFIEEDWKDFPDDQEQYLIREDINGYIFICDLKGEILLHEKLDRIWKVDMTKHFILFKNNSGNIWNCRTNKFLLDKWIESQYFSTDDYGNDYVIIDKKRYMFDVSNTNTDVVKLINPENKNDKPIILKSL